MNETMKTMRILPFCLATTTYKQLIKSVGFIGVGSADFKERFAQLKKVKKARFHREKQLILIKKHDYETTTLFLRTLHFACSMYKR